jgi:IS5 family transposase
MQRINGKMDRSVGGHPLPVKSICRKIRIYTIRSAVEYPYAFFKSMFHFLHVRVKTVQRVRVKRYFTPKCYMLVQARFLD